MLSTVITRLAPKAVQSTPHVQQLTILTRKFNQRTRQFSGQQRTRPSGSVGVLARTLVGGAGRNYIQQAAFGMFCRQCEQTEKQTGCTVVGVCGKDETVASLQDLLVFGLHGLSFYVHKISSVLKNDRSSLRSLDLFFIEAMFATMTNVNFDAQRMMKMLEELNGKISEARAMYLRVCGDNGAPKTGPESFQLASNATVESCVQQAKQLAGVNKYRSANADIASVQELIVYGIKGVCAYADHAHQLSAEDGSVFADLHAALYVAGRSDNSVDLGSAVAAAMQVGQANLRVMELLSKAHVANFGVPSPSKVRTTPVAGKALLVSGHDLHDLGMILEQTKGTGVNVYTHGEMLPAHGYPKLRAHSHLVGNYGGAWQLQQFDFASFPGSVVMTTNCLIEPRKAYKGRLFTRGVVGWPNVTHLPTGDFTPAIQAAQSAPGFAKTVEPAKFTMMTGFGHDAVLSHAEKIISLVKAGKISRFLLVGGCDGSENQERSYFRDIATGAPKDAVVLTLACGKYRFNNLQEQFGDIEGIPRLIDMGQCNDAYSAIQVAVALAKAFNTDVNSLPLSFHVSWFEQKAVAILLTLLSLGIKNIHLGPHLPAFVTPNVLQFLISNFNLMKIGDAKAELAQLFPNKK